MKKKDEEKVSGLPENAYRELKEGEVYKPILSPDKQYREVTPWSVFWGLVMAVLFSAAAAFLGLKVGQVFEAAIPIAIIAVGLSSGFKRKNALGENVIIQSIGANSGVIVAGAIFTLPALYILQDKYPEITINFFEVFMSSLLGGHPRYPAPDPVPEVFRIDHARQISIPGSDCYHTGIGVRREGRQPGKAAYLCGSGRRSVRLHHRDFRLVERDSQHAHRRCRRDAG